MILILTLLILAGAFVGLAWALLDGLNDDFDAAHQDPAPERQWWGDGL